MKLKNYLRTYRKRSGLSQTEVALLFGCVSGTKISRYECLTREPTLRAALAFEAIFHLPVSRLFAGVFDEVRQDTRKRARRLMRRLEQRSKTGPLCARKLAVLKSILASKLTPAPCVRRTM